MKDPHADMLTHLDEQGAAHMVNVGEKPRQIRKATAKGRIYLSPGTLDIVLDQASPKGDVLAAARIAGIMAAKRTPDLIPLCHHVALTSAQVDFAPQRDEQSIEITVSVESVGRTGVEMEALTAVSVAALTLYDMLKAVDKRMSIGGIYLVQKSKRGRSRPVQVVPKGGEHLLPPPVPFASETPAPITSSAPPSGSSSELLSPPPSPSASPMGAAADKTPVVGVALLDGEPTVSSGSERQESPLMESPGPSALLGPPSSMPSSLTPQAEAIEDFGYGDDEASIDVSIHELLPMPVAHEAPSMESLPALVQAKLERVRPLEEVDHQALRAFLLESRMEAAYLLGDLDDPFIEHTRWYGVDDPEDGLTGVLLWYSGLSMPTILPMGSVEDVQALVARVRMSLPRRIFASYLLDHRETFAQFYRPISVKPMLRMALRREDWRPQPHDEAGGLTVSRMSHRDTAAIMSLYRFYPDNFFEPAQLDTGMYYGIRDGDELVSVAGIHVLSDAQDVAVLGNVVTHVDRRGEGLATRTVSRVLDAIFERVGHVALNVQRDNPSAIACYRKFGFTVLCDLEEGWMERM